MTSKADTYMFLYEHCKNRLATSKEPLAILQWKKCVELFEEELDFHRNLLEGRE